MQPIENISKTEKATTLAIFLLVVLLSTLAGCAASGRNLPVTNSQEATDIWHSYEILPNYHYYIWGPVSQPFYIIGIDEKYQLTPSHWKPVDLTPAMLKNWFNYLHPRVGFSPFLYGALITGPNGERIGLWYSVVDWRLTGSATVGENNEVVILMPTDEGRGKRDRNPYENEYDVSNDKGDDPNRFWLGRYSEPADRL